MLPYLMLGITEMLHSRYVNLFSLACTALKPCLDLTHVVSNDEAKHVF